jgi:hypothetical protein
MSDGAASLEPGREGRDPSSVFVKDGNAALPTLVADVCWLFLKEAGGTFEHAFFIVWWLREDGISIFKMWYHFLSILCWMCLMFVSSESTFLYPNLVV